MANILYRFSFLKTAGMFYFTITLLINCSVDAFELKTVIEAVRPIDLSVPHHAVTVRISEAEEESCTVNISVKQKIQLTEDNSPPLATRIKLVGTIGSKGRAREPVCFLSTAQCMSLIM